MNWTLIYPCSWFDNGVQLNIVNYQRLLPRLASLIVLAMITGMLVSLLMAGAVLAAYHLLVRHGLEADMAFMVVGLGVAAMAVISTIFTTSYIRKLRRAMQPFSPIVSGISDLAGAFMDGLMTPSSSKPTERTDS